LRFRVGSGELSDASFDIPPLAGDEVYAFAYALIRAYESLNLTVPPKVGSEQGF